MKKYLLASVLLVGFAGSAYAVTGQFDNMCSWGLANHKDVQYRLLRQRDDKG